MSEKTKTAPASEKKNATESPRSQPAVQPGEPQGVAPVWAAAGNQAMQRLLREGVIKASLEISQPGDSAEQEAEAAARALEASRPIEPVSGNGDPRLQRSKTPGGKGGGVDTAAVQSGLNSIGHALPVPARQRMESHFGQDFGEVRVHTGPEASRSAESISAKAFTLGGDIVFREGQYSPDTIAGQKLLAHELTHVLQQRQTGQPGVLIQRITDAYFEAQEEMRERRAEEARRARELHESWESSHRERFGEDLTNQSTSLAGERERTEQGIIVQRSRMLAAVLVHDTAADLPPDLQTRWNTARQSVESVQFGIEQGDVGWEMQEEVRGSFTGFLQAFQEFALAVETRQRNRETQERERYEEALRHYESARDITFSSPGGEPGEGAFRGGWALANPRPQPGYTAPRPISPNIPPAIQRADAADTVEQWTTVVQDFNNATRDLDTFLIYLLPPSSEERQGFEYFRDLGARLETLESEHPLAVRIPAVFYPRDQFVDLPAPEGGTQTRVAKSIPWQFYLYHTGVATRDRPATSGGEWVLVDMTSPHQEKVNRAGSSDLDAAMLQQGFDVDPPIEMFAALNSRLRFPEGQLYWTMPRGQSWRLETTEPWSLSDWLSAIGMTLGAIALIAGIIVSGGLAAPAAVPALAAIGTAAGIGAAGFGVASTLAGMSERREHGMLTQEDIDRATLSIAVDVAGALALGMGRLVAAAGEAGVRAGMAARLAAYSGRYWFLVQRGAQVATGVALGGDVVQLMTATSDFIRAYRAIQSQPVENDADRERALVRLVATGLLTSGLLAISIRGGVRDLRQGANLHLVDIDAEGRIAVRSPDTLPDLPPAGTRPGVETGEPATPRVGDTSVTSTPGAAGAPAPGWSRRRLLAPEPGPSRIDPDLPSGRVEIRVTRDEAGLVTDIEIRHAADAHPTDIAIHERIGGLIRLYGGEVGRIPALVSRLRRAFGGNPPPLSLQMELRKLRMTAAAHQERLATERLSPQEVRRIENQLNLLRREINNVEAAIADPALRSRYPEDIVGLPVRPTDVPGLPDPPAGHHYFFSPHSNRWEIRRNPNYEGPRFRVEYDGDVPTGRATNLDDVNSVLVGRPVSDARTRARLEAMGYRVDANNVVYRPRGHDEAGRPHMAPLQVDAAGRIQVATTESLGEAQARIRASLDPSHATRLGTLESGLVPGERLRLVEGLHDTGVTWAQVLTPQEQARLRNLLITQEAVPAADVDRMIDRLLNRPGTLKVVLGTGGVREAFPYRERFGEVYGEPAAGVEVHHGDPLYLGGGSNPESMLGLPPGPHDRLHAFFDDLRLPASGNPPGTRLQPTELQNRVRSSARPAAAIIDTEGNIRYVFLDQPLPATSP